MKDSKLVVVKYADGMEIWPIEKLTDQAFFERTVKGYGDVTITTTEKFLGMLVEHLELPEIAVDW